MAATNTEVATSSELVERMRCVSTLWRAFDLYHGNGCVDMKDPRDKLS